MAINSLYIVGNSYSATTQPTANQAWPGMLCAALAFPFIQANNVAVPGCQILNGPMPAKPGLLAQLNRIPTGPKAGALLVLWIFPALNENPLNPQAAALYTSGMDLANRKGFRMVLMPNLPDITKTALYKRSYTRVQLATMHSLYANFNTAYNTMISSFVGRYHNSIRFATYDVFTRWDGTGTVPDGLHPNTDTHRLFAQWFKTAVNNF